MKKTLYMLSIIALLSSAFVVYEIVDNVMYVALWADVTRWLGYITFPLTIFIWFYVLLSEIEIKLKRIFFAIFAPIGLVLLIASIFYSVTPYLDFAAVSISLPRMCDTAKNELPDVYENLILCHVDNEAIQKAFLEIK